MCGIIGIISKKPIVKDLMASLVKLEYRGYDSAGIAVVDDGRIVVSKDVGYVSSLRVDYSLQGTIGIGHTRWATHGRVTKENAHPFTDCRNEIAIVHNGIIDNYEELKKELSERHVFLAETDSEVIAHLIEDYMPMHDFKTAFGYAVKRLEGSYAIVAVHKDYPHLVVARKDSPLMVGMILDSVYVASDSAALEGRHIDEVPDGYVGDITMNGYVQNVVGLSADKGGYEHYMLKEIYEQPVTLIKALRQDRDKFIGVAFDVLRARNVILAACGTSRFASLVGRYLMSHLAKKFSEVLVGSELHYFADSFDDSTLILAVSQSGETADILMGVKLAKRKGSRIVSVVNRPFSSLERLSDTTLLMNCGPEISVASTKAFTNELVIFYMLAFTMANQYDVGLVELGQLSDKVRDCLSQSDRIKEVADAIKDTEHMYYIGKGINFAVSGECALKLKEVSYIHAESMAAGELKHGTLSLVGKGIPVVGLCPNDYSYQETLSNLHEVKARDGMVIGISDKQSEVFDYWLPIPKVKDIYYPLVSVIIGQLLAYHVAVAKGLDPDRPKNLAKSVTVL